MDSIRRKKEGTLARKKEGCEREAEILKYQLRSHADVSFHELLVLKDIMHDM